MNVAILVCTFGGSDWRDLGHRTAAASDAVACHQWRGTLASVRNEAASLFDTDWLCFLDADDSLAPGYIDAMEAAAPTVSPPMLLAPAVDYGSGAFIPAWGRPLIDVNCMVIGTLVPAWLFREVGGFRELPALEDWDLWLRCVAAGATVVGVPCAVYRAQVGQRRNLDQEPYDAIRREHLAARDWSAVDEYTVCAA